MQDNPPTDPTPISDIIADLSALFSHGVPDGAAERRGHHPSPAEAWSPQATQNRLVAAFDMAHAISTSDDRAEMMQYLVDGSRAIVGARFGTLILRDEGGEPIVHLSGVSTGEGAAPGMRCLLQTASMPEFPLIIPDVHTLRQAADLPASHPAVSSLLGVPVRVDGHQVGYLYLADRVSGEPFGREDIDSLQALVDRASAVIDEAPRHTANVTVLNPIEAQLSQLRTIMDTLPAGVIVLAPPDGRVELANGTAITTILGEQETGDRLPVIYQDFRWLRADGTELPRAHHPGMLALRGQAMGTRALTLWTGRGESIPVRVQSTPIYGRSGEILRSVVLFLDVSRERAAEQVKDDFLSLISHEFRTPLTAIHGGALLLAQQGEAMDPDTRRELLQDIGEESARLDRMLGNLLSVSEIMAGRFQPSTEPILVAPLVQPLVDEFSRRSPIHQFTMTVDPDIAPAEGAPELLVQILRNLFENAVKYSPGGGEIRTVIQPHDGNVSIEVIDNGLGVSAEHVPHVFERFRRPGAEPTVRGMGLGLYLSRLLVDAQGGSIRASSPGPGQGATFQVELPMVRDWERDHDSNVQAEQ